MASLHSAAGIPSVGMSRRRRRCNEARRLRPPRAAQRAFTLVELMIGIPVLSVCMGTRMRRHSFAGRPPVRGIDAGTRESQRGVMLIEMLIAVLLFSLGILGIVALQAQSIRHVGDAQYRGEAVFLANALVSQMWVDDRTSIDKTYLDTTYGDAGGGPGYAAFKEMVRTLPGADLSTNAPQVKVAAGPATTSSVVTVTVFWQLPGEPSPHNYSTTAVIGRNP